MQDNQRKKSNPYMLTADQIVYQLGIDAGSNEKVQTPAMNTNASVDNQKSEPLRLRNPICVSNNH